MEFDIVREREVSAATRDALAQAVRTAEPIWHWGDGHGGTVAMMLVEEARRRGLSLPSLEYGIPVTSASRQAIFERDAYRCVNCGDWHDLSIDHIWPRALGGTDHESNLQTLCRKCNSSKGARVA